MAERYTSTGNCVECMAERAKAKNDRERQALTKLMSGELSEKEARRLKSPWYCTGLAQQCGHIAWQRVIDGRCKVCLNQEEAKRKEQLEIAKQLLS